MFSTGGQGIDLAVSAPTSLIFCHADQIDAPVMAAGPFVMITSEDFRKAFEDFGSGRVLKGALA